MPLPLEPAPLVEVLPWGKFGSHTLAVALLIPALEGDVVLQLRYLLALLFKSREQLRFVGTDICPAHILKLQLGLIVVHGFICAWGGELPLPVVEDGRVLVEPDELLHGSSGVPPCDLYGLEVQLLAALIPSK